MGGLVYCRCGHIGLMHATGPGRRGARCTVSYTFRPCPCRRFEAQAPAKDPRHA